MAFWNKLESVTAESVKQKIEDSLKPDNKLSESEKKEIDDLYKKVSTEKWKKEVTDFIKSKFSGDTKTELLSLTNNVEIIKGDFNMETLAKNSKSDLFNKILKKESALVLYKIRFISPIIEKNKDLFVNGQDTIELIYWKKITDEIWLKSAMWMAWDKIVWFFWGIVGKISEIWDDSKSEDMDLSKMWDLVDKLWKIWDKPDEAWLKKLWGIMWKLKWYLDYMTKDYTSNLNILIELWKKSDKDWLQKLLDNPVVLDEVLKTGKYNKDWYNIDLENKKVSFNNNPDIKKSKDEFMKLAIKATNGNGSKLDWISKKTKQLAKTFEKFWLKSDDLRSFRDWLKDIPIIWDFLFALVSLFLWDKVLNLMDKNPWEKEFEISWKNLQTYIKDNKDKLPFIVWEEDFEDVKVAWKTESFLEKVKKANKQNFDNIEENKKQLDPKYKKLTKETSLIDNKDFWKNIFSEDEPSNSILKQLWQKAKTLKNKNLSIEEFFEELNKDLKINIEPVKKVLTETEKALKSIDDKEAQKLVSADRDLLLPEIEKLTAFPWVIKIKDSAWVEKELRLDFKDSKLLLNGKEFVLKNWDISDIKFDKTDITLKIKDLSWVESEKKVSKNEFAEMIAWLAVWTPVVGLEFVTLKEKNNFIKDSKNKAEKEAIDKKNAALKAEQTKINLEIKQLTIDLKPDSELNQKVLKLKWEVDNIKNKIKDKEQELEKNKKEIIGLNANIDLLKKQNTTADNDDTVLWWFKEKISSIKEWNNEKIIWLQTKKTEKDNQISNLNRDISDLNTNLKTKKIEYKNQNTILEAKKLSLTKKQKRLIEIKTELWASDKELKALQDKMNAEKKAREAEEKAEIERIEQEKKKAEELRKKVELEKSKKSFKELLESPKETKDLELTLSDNTKITFDKSDNTINFWWEKFGIKNPTNMNKLLIKAFSFESIYKLNKEDFITVLNELKINKKSILKIWDEEISFIKIS